MSRIHPGADAVRLKACGALLADIADKAATIRRLSILCVEAMGDASDEAAAMACASGDLAAVIGALSDEGLQVAGDIQQRGPALEWLGSPIAIECVRAASGDAP